MKFIRTNNHHPKFAELVDLLDEVLKIADGKLHDFYHQYNGIDLSLIHI